MIFSLTSKDNIFPGNISSQNPRGGFGPILSVLYNEFSVSSWRIKYNNKHSRPTKCICLSQFYICFQFDMLWNFWQDTINFNTIVGLLDVIAMFCCEELIVKTFRVYFHNLKLIFFVMCSIRHVIIFLWTRQVLYQEINGPLFFVHWQALSCLTLFQFVFDTIWILFCTYKF